MTDHDGTFPADVARVAYFSAGDLSMLMTGSKALRGRRLDDPPLQAPGSLSGRWRGRVESEVPYVTGQLRLARLRSGAKVDAMSMHSTMPALLAFAPSLRKASNRALSVYLPVRSEGFVARHYDLVIGHLVRRYGDRLGVEDREVMEREIPRVRVQLELVRPAGSPALAAFADEAAGLLELIRLPVETEARLEVGPLLLAPIERLLERFPPTLIAVVDKEEARAFGAILGEVVPLDHLVGMDVKHHKAGGTSASSNQRKAENRAKANLTAFVSMIEHEMRAGSYERLYLAGPEEARAEFERLLPPGLKRSIAGHLSASLDSAQLQHQLRDQIQRALELMP